MPVIVVCVELMFNVVVVAAPELLIVAEFSAFVVTVPELLIDAEFSVFIYAITSLIMCASFVTICDDCPVIELLIVYVVELPS